MRSPLLIGLAWVATVALAFLLGGQLRSDAPARDDARIPSGALPLAAAPEAPPHPPPMAAETSAPRRAEPEAATPPEPEPEALEPIVIEPGMDPADFSALLMRYAAAKLAEGPEGQKELFREFDKLLQDRQLRQMFRDESQVMPFVYPWVRFLVEHDRQVVAMMETLYRTAAEEPQWFEGLDDNSFEVFTEGLALLLPGATSEEQLARFRSYAEKIVAMDPQSLPGALQKNLRDIQRDLEWWAPPLTPEEVVQVLGDPARPLATKIAILRRASPDSLGGVDVTPIVVEAFREKNRYATSVLLRFRQSVSMPTVDAAFLDAAAEGEIHWAQIRSYTDATGRTEWATLRPFLDTGFARGGKATDAFAQSLMYYGQLVPKEYVTTVVTTYPLSDQVRESLKKRYGLE